MSTAQPQAQSIRCESCGAAFSVERLASALQCPFCHHVQQLQPQRLQQLQQYQARVQQHQLNAMQHELIIGGSRTPPIPPLSTPEGRKLLRRFLLAQLAAAVFVALPIVTSQLVLYGPDFAAWNSDILMMWPVFTMIGLGVAAAVTWAHWDSKHKPSKRQANIQSTCPHCGAPNALRPGQRLEACTHCGASLLPSAQQQQLDLQIARQREMIVAQQAQVIEQRHAQPFERSTGPRSDLSTAYAMAAWMPVGVLIALCIPIEPEQPVLNAVKMVFGWSGFVALPLLMGVSAWRSHRRSRSQRRDASP